MCSQLRKSVVPLALSGKENADASRKKECVSERVSVCVWVYVLQEREREREKEMVVGDAKNSDMFILLLAKHVGG